MLVPMYNTKGEEVGEAELHPDIVVDAVLAKRNTGTFRNLAPLVVGLGPGFRAEHLAFGGVKDSGIGREGVRYAVEAMTTLKTVVM